MRVYFYAPPDHAWPNKYGYIPRGACPCQCQCRTIAKEGVPETHTDIGPTSASFLSNVTCNAACNAQYSANASVAGCTPFDPKKPASFDFNASNIGNADGGVCTAKGVYPPESNKEARNYVECNKVFQKSCRDLKVAGADDKPSGCFKGDPAFKDGRYGFRLPGLTIPDPDGTPPWNGTDL